MKLKNKVVVFDLDGTLLDSQNNVIGGVQTLKCLQLLQDMGCTLAICTGRLDHDIVKIQNQYQLPIAHRISQNGAVTICKEDFHGLLLDKTEAMSIYSYIKTLKVRIELNTVTNRYWQSARDPDFPKELYDSHIIREDYEEVIQCQPVVLFLIIGEHQQLNMIADFIHQHYINTKAIFTSATSLEVLNKKASKGQALKNNFADCDVYAIGDSPSDFDMIPYSQEFYNVGTFENPSQSIQKETILDALKDIKTKLGDIK